MAFWKDVRAKFKRKEMLNFKKRGYLLSEEFFKAFVGYTLFELNDLQPNRKSVL